MSVRVLLLPVARMPVFCNMCVVGTRFVHLGEESQCGAQFHVERKNIMMVTKEAGMVQW